MTLDILCKVVDNFGDIGLVYRLARALTEIDPSLHLRLHVDDLTAFASLCPEVDPLRPIQRLRGWTLIDWRIGGPELREACAEAGLPSLVIECFACGRPPALEDILFDPLRNDGRLIVNLEHLSAEAWADELHRMPSATRSGLVKKLIFMPGFSPSTGGLIIDRGFREAAALWAAARGPAPSPSGIAAPLSALRLSFAERAHIVLSPGDEARPWISLFSYERDYKGLVTQLGAWASRHAQALVLAAAGRSAKPFLEAWRGAGEPFPVITLPFLPQELWDECVLASDFAIIRGEESLARAALAGLPFLWHAYRQDDNYQLVKLRALLDLLRPAFARTHAPETAIAAYEKLSLAFNDRLVDSPTASGGEGEDFGPLLDALPYLRPGFEAFGASLFANGDLAKALLAFLRDPP